MLHGVNKVIFSLPIILKTSVRAPQIFAIGHAPKSVCIFFRGAHPLPVGIKN